MPRLRSTRGVSLLSSILAAALGLLILALPASPLQAQVCNIKVVTDANPDYSDIGSMFHSITDNWTETKDKCWAIFYWNHIARRQTMPVVLHGMELTDPIRQFNDYGYTMCSTISGINCAIFAALGRPVKFWDISLHTVMEAEFDGKYHMFDNSLSALYTTCDGKTLAGVAEIGAPGACEKSGGKVEPGHIAKYHCLYSTSPNGFLTGCDTQRSVAEEYRCFNPNGLKYRYYYNNWDLGHRYILNLRPGERYTRYYHRLDADSPNKVPQGKQGKPGKKGSDADPAHFAGPTDYEAANPRYHIRANGLRSFVPELSGQGLATSAEWMSGVRAAEGGGVEPTAAGKPGEVVFKIDGANVITSMLIEASFVCETAIDLTAISVSTNNGVTWKEVWNSGKAQGWRVSGVRHVVPKWSISQMMSRLGRSILMGGSSSPEQFLAGRDSCQQGSKLVTIELPRKGLRMLVAQVLVKRQPHPNGIQVGKIVRRQHLALNDREVDLHLVEPTGVDRRMHQDDARIDFHQTVASRFAAVGRAIIYNPEQPLRRAVGLLREDLDYQSTKRFDAGRCFATSHDVSTTNIPGRQILQRSASLVFALYPRCPARPRSQRGMDANACLNARLLVGPDDKVLVFQGFSLPMPRVQVKDRPGLCQELRVSRKDPVLVLPGLDGVLVQDPPYRAAADCLAQRRLCSRREIFQGLPTNRLAGFRDSFTSQGLDQCVIPRGKNRPYDRVPRHPPRKTLPLPSVSASDEPVGARGPRGGQGVPDPSQDVHGPAAPTVIAAPNAETPSCGALPFAPLPRIPRGKLDNKSDPGQPWLSSSPWTCSGILTGEGIIPYHVLEP